MPGVHQLSGSKVQPDELQFTLSKGVCRNIHARGDGRFELLECRVLDTPLQAELLIIRARSKIPQRPVFDFRDEEDLCLAVWKDGQIPDLFSLRSDFPHAPHMNVIRQGGLAWICLFGEDPDEVRRRLTPELLLERILWWFEKNAIGALQQSNQAPEPFLVGNLRPIYFTSDIFSSNPPAQLSVFSAYPGTEKETLVADRPEHVPPELRGNQAVLLQFTMPMQTAGLIHYAPTNLHQLAELCTSAGFDFLPGFEQALLQRAAANTGASVTLILLAIPKGNPGDETPALTEYRAFRLRLNQGGQALDAAPGIIAIALSLGWADGSRFVTKIGAHVSAGSAKQVEVSLLTPFELTTRDEAAKLSGSQCADTRPIVAVGVGALGSQVVGNLVRRGFGQWTLIDQDRLEPHNLARHLVFDKRYGFSKAHEVAARANDVFGGPAVARSIVANINSPNEMGAQVEEAIRGAELILDMSASTAAARTLAANNHRRAPVMSLFLTPQGRDLVLMYEGTRRNVRIDEIEMQYLRALLNREDLIGLLDRDSEQIQYGAGCRDRSAVIATELVSLHAAIGARVVQTTIGSENAKAVIWRCNEESMELRRVELPIRDTSRISFGEWTLIFDDGLKQKIMEMRSAKLPKETCGILLGQIDALQHAVYVVDALPATSDTQEDASWCKRGIEGLKDSVDTISAVSGGEVNYIGEWHSHPDRCSCDPSMRDLEQLAWICDRMHPAGLPAVIVIACASESLTLLLSPPGADYESRTG